MQAIKSILMKLCVAAVIFGIGFCFIQYYSYIFSKTLKGEIVSVERVTESSALINTAQINPDQLYSFAVAIRTSDNGEIHTASTNDRQWAVAQKGQCVEAKYYPYPPWDFEKGGTYFNARLMKLMDCPVK